MTTRVLQWATAATYAVIVFLMVYGIAGAQAVTDAVGELDRMAALENWQVITGFLLPLLMAAIIQSSWSRGLKSLATMVASLIITGVARALQSEAVVVPELVIQGLELFALTIPFYLGVWKPTEVAPKIEAATNF